VRLEFRASQFNSDGGLLLLRELDDAPGLSDLASAALVDNGCGRLQRRRDDSITHNARRNKARPVCPGRAIHGHLEPRDRRRMVSVVGRPPGFQFDGW